MDVSCWVGSFSFELCCTGPWAIGLESCWDEHFTWEKCCRRELENITGSSLNEQVSETLETAKVFGTAGDWKEDMATCISEYDKEQNSDWFLRHTALMGHHMAHVGNPGDCLAGGHRFFWGLLVLRTDGIFQDVGLEYGLCVPRFCSYAVVDAILVPFTFGQFLDKPWGPKPEVLGRWRLGNDDREPKPKLNDFIYETLAKYPGGAPRFYTEQWTFRQGLWEYSPTWWPSPTNQAVLSSLVAPPLIAGLCIMLGFVNALDPKQSRQRENRGQVNPKEHVSNGISKKKKEETKHLATPDAEQEVGNTGPSACGSLVRLFAPQTHLKPLFADAKPGGEELAGLHTVRLVLQALVCWQHVVLLVDWVGNGGYSGIAGFAPIANHIAKALGRVNSTFACITAYMGLESMARVLQQSSEKRPLARLMAIPVWVLRRWIRQAAELGFWTWYFVMLSEDIPWKPFPDFVQVWYRQRVGDCLRLPTGELKLPFPMWLLSLLFVYEPMNSCLKLFDPPVSLCHNMQVFENLFAISLAGAALAVARHFGGRFLMFSVTALILSIALWREPDMMNQVHSDARYEKVVSTTANMMAAALTTAILLSEVLLPAGRSVRSKITRHPVVFALLLIGLGLLADFLILWYAPRTRRKVSEADIEATQIDYFMAGAWLVQEALHAIGVALLLHSLAVTRGSSNEGVNGIGTCDPAESKQRPSRNNWFLAASRLSLGVNLVNIFAIHYLRGRVLEQPIEFNHIHVLQYTVTAWIAAFLVSLVVHCLVTPYVKGMESFLQFFLPAPKTRRAVDKPAEN